MVRTMPSSPFNWAELLERVRPGIAISAAIHAGLFVLLAYLLAFHSPMPAPPQDPQQVLVIIDPPTTPPPVKIEVPKLPTFKPIESKPVRGVQTTVHPFVLAPVDSQDNGPAQTTASSEAPPTVIVNPTPIYRGGLVYPDRAADLGREGYVDFDFIIEPDGTVGNPVVIAEVPDGIGFAAAAKKAFPKWRFNPMMKDGVPVATPARIRVSFKLS